LISARGITPAPRRPIVTIKSAVIAEIENYLRTARTESERWPAK
jgi:hypothetical protein